MILDDVSQAFVKYPDKLSHDVSFLLKKNTK